MPTLKIWDQEEGATDAYWRFTEYCMGIHRRLYGNAPYSKLPLRDILQEQLYLQGAGWIDDQQALEFRSEQHKTMWMIRWST